MFCMLTIAAFCLLHKHSKNRFRKKRLSSSSQALPEKNQQRLSRPSKLPSHASAALTGPTSRYCRHDHCITRKLLR